MKQETCLYYILTAVFTSAEVITLTRGKDIACILTKNSTNFNPWIQPQIEPKFYPKSPKYGGWTLTQSEHSNFGPATDERWLSFRPANDYQLSKEFPVSFSVCNFGYLILILHSRDFTNHKMVQLTQRASTVGSQCQWFHYTIEKSDDRTVTLSSSNGTAIQKYTTNFVVFGVEHPKSKFHSYDFLCSNTTSNIKENSFSSIYFGKLCVSMFVSLDRYCDLEIIAESENKTIFNKTITGNNDPNSLRTWKKVVVNESFSGWWTLHLFRKRSDNETIGFWAVDGIQVCDPIREIFRGTLPLRVYTDYTCQIENDDNSFNFCNKPGYLGENCDISCEEVLGKSYPNCEGHKICKRSDSCMCPWGYTGSSCAESCSDGFSGPDCNFKCDVGSHLCEKCEELFFGPQCSKMFPIILQAPILRSISNTSASIHLNNLEYNQNGSEPEYFQIQYKKVGDELFSNYSEQIPFYTNLTNITYQINNLQTDRYSYIVRVILIVQGQSYLKNVPELEIKKRKKHLTTLGLDDNNHCISENLQINFTDDGHMSIIRNEGVESSSTVAYLDCWGVHKFCLNYTIQSHTTILKESGEFVNLQGFENCTITLYEDATYLTIDKIGVKIPIFITEAELPKVVRLYKNKLYMELESCDTFFGPLVYKVRLNCTSKCNSQQQQQERYINVTEYKSFISVDLQNILPFATYAIEIFASRSSASLSRLYGNITAAPSGNVTNNLDVYCRNESTLWVKWQPPNVLRENLPRYRVTYEKGDRVVSSSSTISRCELWDNFLCTNITGLTENTSYLVKVQEDIMYLNLSESTMNITAVTKQEAPEAPENLSLAVTADSKVNLTWSNPLHMNGPVQEFRIKVESDDGVINNYSISVQNYLRIYHCTIPINISRQCKISVWAVNQFEGVKTTKPLTVFSIEHVTLQIGNLALTIILFAVAVLGYLIFTYTNVLSSCRRTPEVELQSNQIYGRDSKEERTCDDEQVEAQCKPLIDKTEEFNSHIDGTHSTEMTSWANSTSMKVTNLEENLNQLCEEDNEGNELARQFQKLSQYPLRSCLIGSMSNNLGKNRYKNRIAYDETRVVLKNNPEKGDYINANYIAGYENPKAFIATQAPLPATLEDFWQMVCQEKCKTIVMLSQLKENGRVKCEQYWPETKKSCKFGKFVIHNVSTRIFPDYVERELEVKYEWNAHSVQHLQYIDFPAFGVPVNLQNFTEFLRTIMEIDNPPIIVHCSGGCGRTGTLILSDIILRMSQENEQVNFVKVLKTIREQRAHLITNVNQYMFAHYAVREYLFRTDFSIPVNLSFSAEVNKATTKKRIICLLEQLNRQLIPSNETNFNSMYSTRMKHEIKNRFSAVLPVCSRLSLQQSKLGVSVGCYGSPNKFIVTHQPFSNTVSDFWRLVKESEVDTILSLNEIEENDSNCPNFWPFIEDATISVRFCEENENNESYSEVKLKVTDEQEKFVSVIQMKKWKSQTLKPPSLEDLIAIREKIKEKKVVVTCYDGATASGFFVALAYLLAKIDVERICDVFSAVRAVRHSRPQFIKDLVQLEMLYQVAIRYQFTKKRM